MRVERWKAKEVLTTISEQAIKNGNTVMDEVVQESKRICPVDLKTYRPGYFAVATVSFTPKTGRNKGLLVQFNTSKRWMGRSPGNLRDTIRRVNKPHSGNIRVYAGNFKIYWAFMIEKGFHDRGGKWHEGRRFLRGPFHAKRSQILDKIKNG